MKLTRFTDYSLRVLIYLGIRKDARVTEGEIAKRFNISPNHLMKIVQHLSREGYLQTSRGRQGGVRLATSPASINIADVVRSTESTHDVINCFEPHCPIVGACRLQGALGQARDAFFAVLDAYTLESLLRNEQELARRMSGTRDT